MPRIPRALVEEMLAHDFPEMSALVARLDEAGFRALFAKSPVKRTGRDRFVRNVLIAMGNAGDPSLAPLAPFVPTSGPTLCPKSLARASAASPSARPPERTTSAQRPSPRRRASSSSVSSTRDPRHDSLVPNTQAPRALVAVRAKRSSSGVIAYI